MTTIKCNAGVGPEEFGLSAGAVEICYRLHPEIQLWARERGLEQGFSGGRLGLLEQREGAEYWSGKDGVVCEGRIK